MEGVDDNESITDRDGSPVSATSAEAASIIFSSDDVEK